MYKIMFYRYLCCATRVKFCNSFSTNQDKCFYLTISALTGGHNLCSTHGGLMVVFLTKCEKTLFMAITRTMLQRLLQVKVPFQLLLSFFSREGDTCTPFLLLEDSPIATNISYIKDFNFEVLKSMSVSQFVPYF